MASGLDPKDWAAGGSDDEDGPPTIVGADHQGPGADGSLPGQLRALKQMLKAGEITATEGRACFRKLTATGMAQDATEVLGPCPGGAVAPLTALEDMDLEDLKRDLRRCAMESKESYQPPAVDGVRPPRLPTLTIAVTGETGNGKSSFINGTCSVLSGSTVAPTRATGGPESVAGTTKCRLIPIHEYLWPGVPHPPAYVYIWDTVGFEVGSVTTAEHVGAAYRSVEDGSIAPGAHSTGAYQARGADQEHLFPVPCCVFAVGAFTRTAAPEGAAPGAVGELDGAQPALLKVQAEYFGREGQTEAIPLPLYGLMAKCDGAADVQELAATGDWDGVALAAEKLKADVSALASMPMQRLFPIFGLNSLGSRVGGTRDGDDARELALLLPLCTAVREQATRTALNRDTHLRMCAAGTLAVAAPVARVADQTASLIQASAVRVGPLLIDAQSGGASTHAKETMRALGAALVRQDIDGRMLVGMPDAAMRQLLVEVCPALLECRGVLETVSRLAMPYRCA